MSVSYPTKLLLAYRSGDRCALSDCGRELSPDSEDGDPINVGEAAHIAGEHDGKGKAKKSARYDPNMTDEERNHYNNLIYLCGTCHTKIDAIPQGEKDYPVGRLQKIKAEHEQKVREAVTEAFFEIGFRELEEATQWIMQISPQQANQGFLLIPPQDKLKKNDLGNASRTIVTMGLSVSREVRAFVESVAQTDTDFPERLKAGFLEEYYKLRREGHAGDDLFDLMCSFAQRGFREQAKRSAGLAVLVYLFEACEVFEK
jgi:hypothetical protein